jgi:putative membrane protein
MKMEWMKWSMIALVAVTISISACDDDDDDNDNVKKEWSQTDKNFVTKANESNRAEIELGTLAASQASNASVKSFGQRMVNDHQGALQELQQLADNKDFTLSSELTTEHKELKTRLSGLSGYSFDTAYINSQVMDHNKAISLFENESTHGDDQSLKNYANKYLPHIRDHRELADSLTIVLHESDTVTTGRK